MTAYWNSWIEGCHGEKILPEIKHLNKQIIAMKQVSRKMHNSKIGGSQFGVTYV